MPAYLIFDINVKDPVEYAKYRDLATPAVTAYGGKYLVRGGAVETLEGVWPISRFVILEFPSVAQAKAWWNSPEYAPAKALRHHAAESKMIVVEGYTP